VGRCGSPHASEEDVGELVGVAQVVHDVVERHEFRLVGHVQRRGVVERGAAIDRGTRAATVPSATTT
jgi:hypothetical protein